MGNEIRVYFDGSFNKSFKSSAFVVKADDKIIYKHSAYVDVPSSVYAEYKALELGLTWAQKEFKNSKKNIVFFGDCKPVVTYVSQFKYLDRPSEFELLINYHHSCRNAYDTLRAFHKVSLKWVPRSLNAEADTCSRPFHERHGWRYSIIKEINNIIVDYSRKMNIRNIQQTIIDFLNHYTGCCNYKCLTNDQLTFLHNRMLELKCACNIQ